MQRSSASVSSTIMAIVVVFILRDLLYSIDDSNSRFYLHHHELIKGI